MRFVVLPTENWAEPVIHLVNTLALSFAINYSRAGSTTALTYVTSATASHVNG